MKWIILLTVVLFSVSCSNDPKEIKLGKASLKVDIKAAELAAGLKTGYKRGQAPVYIAGVTLTADNTEYNIASVVNIVQTFNFASDVATDGEDIVLTGLTVGTNSITAVGICDNTAENAHYSVLSEATGGNLKEKADAYAEVLRGKQPIYAAYTEDNAVEKVISAGDNAITVNMVTDNHRVAVVLENPDGSEYVLKIKIWEGDEDLFPLVDDFIEAGAQEAFVINNAEATGSKTYTVKVSYFTRVSHELMDTITKTISVVSYDNITKLYQFSKDDLLEGEASTTFTWTPLEEKNSGEPIQ